MTPFQLVAQGARCGGRAGAPHRAQPPPRGPGARDGAQRDHRRRFAGDERFDADARAATPSSRAELAFCGVVGTEMPVEPAARRARRPPPRRRPARPRVDRVRRSPHASATLTARPRERATAHYDYALTHDRELAAAATAALMARDRDLTGGARRPWRARRPSAGATGRVRRPRRPRAARRRARRARGRRRRSRRPSAALDRARLRRALRHPERAERARELVRLAGRRRGGVRVERAARSASTASSSVATRSSARGLASRQSAAMAACRPWSGGSATPLEGTLQPPMRRAVTPRGTGLGAGDLAALSAVSGLRLETFRPEHVADRIDRALAAERLRDATALAARMRGDGRVRERFRRSVAVSHSGFFRDPEQFEALEQRLLPRLLSTRPGSAPGRRAARTARAVVARGRPQPARRPRPARTLLGSDLLEENLTVARAGVYDVVEITPALKARARWERRDLTLEAPPGGRFDLIMCRNVAIYFEPATKARVHRPARGRARARGRAAAGPLRAPRRSRGARPAACRAARLRTAAMTTRQGASPRPDPPARGRRRRVRRAPDRGLRAADRRRPGGQRRQPAHEPGPGRGADRLGPREGGRRLRDGRARVRHHGPRRVPGPARRRPRGDPRRGADDPDRGEPTAT